MQWNEIPREEMKIPGERYAPGTPYFKYLNVFNEPQSKLQGKPVYELLPVVEIRFPANPQYKPVFGVDEQCTVDEDTGRVITWAERYKNQYAAFVAGAEQQAEGTPLEELLPYGISQAQLSICRALSIYSIEQLVHLEGPAVKRLGIHANDLKPMAQRFMDARRDGSQQQSEINELKRQLAELQGKQDAPLSNVMQDAEPELPSGYEDMSDDQLKEEIAKIAGNKPRGNPSRETLIRSLEELMAA